MSAAEKIRIVCLSDTHNHGPGEGFTLPKGDILIHAGDLTNQGTLKELQHAVKWIEEADFGIKIVVAGNHDLSLDARYGQKYESGWSIESQDVEQCRSLLQDSKTIHYLEHESLTLVVKGQMLNFFGSPYSVDRGKQNWAFQYEIALAWDTWRNIPANTDVLITHTPPQGLLDESTHWKEGGCSTLGEALEVVRPRLHICGHCHEGRGASTVIWPASAEDTPEIISWDDPGSNNKKQSLVRAEQASQSPRKSTTVVNASILAKSWGKGPKAFNKPIVVDLFV